VVRASLYDVEVGHRRLEREDSAFTHRMYLWLVDVDDLPRLPRVLAPLARFRAGDHVGDPARTLRENLEAFLVARGRERPAGRITMLAHARVLGHVFNPITLYWCHDADGAVTDVVAEVHNTSRRSSPSTASTGCASPSRTRRSRRRSSCFVRAPPPSSPRCADGAAPRPWAESSPRPPATRW
jgi:hypothetical protein